MSIVFIPRNRQCAARYGGRARAARCRRRGPAWSGCGGPFASRSGAARAPRPSPRARTNGTPTRRPSARARAPSLSNTSAASRSSSPGGCKSAKKRLRCSGWDWFCNTTVEWTHRPPGPFKSDAANEKHCRYALVGRWPSSTVTWLRDYLSLVLQF